NLGAHPEDSVTIKAQVHPGVGAQAASADHLTTLPLIGSLLSEAEVKGTLEGHVALSGTLSKLEGEFEGAVNNLNVLGSNMAPLRFKGFVEGGRIEVPI